MNRLGRVVGASRSAAAEARAAFSGISAASGRKVKRPFDLVVAAAADESYAWPAALALISAAARTSVSTMCILLGDRLSGELSAAIQDAFGRLAIPFDYVEADFGEFSSFPTGFYLSRATYGRLCIAETGRRFASRTLYLDSDTLVVGDVAPLAQVNLGDHLIAAVRSWEHATVSSPGCVVDWEERGFDPAAHFFNAGVLLIDNDAWLREDVSSRVGAAIRRRPETVTFADQGTLNAILYDRWVELPWHWNHQILRTPTVRIGPWVVSRYFGFSLGKVRVLHYLTDVKPWHPSYPPGYFGTIYRRYWARYLPVPAPPGQTYRKWLRARYFT